MKIRIAVIGCGAITLRRHAPEIAADERCELVGVYNPRRERAEAIAEKFNCGIYDSIESILSDETIDAIYVCTANKDHAKISIAALNAGKHVMCEKPLAVSVEECKAMLEASKRAGKVLMVGHDMRFDSANMMAHDILASGRLGKVITIRSSVTHAGPDNWSLDNGRHTWFFKKEAAVFGAMGDVGVHKMDLIRYLLDDDFDRLCAMTGTLAKTDENDRPISVEDNAACLFVTKKGVQGIMEASWCNYGKANMSTDILCENGRMKVLMDDTYPIIIEWRDGSQSNLKPAANQDSGITKNFIDSILNGTDNPNLGASGCKTVAAVVACIDSASSGHWVKVNNDMFDAMEG